MGGLRTHASRSRPRATAAVALAALLALLAVACGGEESSDANEAAGRYPVKVTDVEFPARQFLGQTSLLRMGFRNTGRKTIPALTVSISVAGHDGQASNLPFGIRDPQPGLAQPDRPVWVLAARYPKFAGSPEPGGAESSNPKTYVFDALKPGATANAVWKLSAVRTGAWTLRFSVDAGLGGQTRAVTAGGDRPGGSIAARIVSRTPDKEVADNGEVVER